MYVIQPYENINFIFKNSFFKKNKQKKKPSNFNQYLKREVFFSTDPDDEKENMLSSFPRKSALAYYFFINKNNLL